MNRQIKIFSIVAVASIGTMALVKLLFIFSSIFRWDIPWSVNIVLTLLSSSGLLAAYILLLVAKKRDKAAICGVVGCGMLILPRLIWLMNVQLPNWLDYPIIAIDALGMAAVAASIALFPKWCNTGAKIAGAIGCGYDALVGLLWLVCLAMLRSGGGGGYASFPNEIFKIYDIIARWPGLVAYVLFAVPFAMLLINKGGAGEDGLSVGGTSLSSSAAAASAQVPQTSIAPQSTVASKSPVAARLSELQELLASGLITKEEYEDKRSKIIASI